MNVPVRVRAQVRFGVRVTVRVTGEVRVTGAFRSGSASGFRLGLGVWRNRGTNWGAVCEMEEVEELQLAEQDGVQHADSDAGWRTACWVDTYTQGQG